MIDTSFSYIFDSCDNSNETLPDRFMTFSIPDEIKNLIIQEANKSDPIECCGYWVPSKGLVIPAKNTHAKPKNNFSIEGSYHASIMNLYPDAVIYHSHVGEDTASLLSHRDIESSKRTKVPYLVYHCQYQEWDYFDPGNLNPYPFVDRPYLEDNLDFYLGIPWQWDRFDCYSLFRNYYKGILGITLRDFSRKGEEGIVSDPNWNQYTNNYESQGFLSIPLDSELQKNDVLLMTLVGEQIHHALIVVDILVEKSIGIQILGEGRISERVVIGEALRRRTRMIIRHKDYM